MEKARDSWLARSWLTLSIQATSTSTKVGEATTKVWEIDRYCTKKPLFINAEFVLHKC